MEMTTWTSWTDRFRLVRELGKGGMGVVYEAEDRERQAIVALKVLPRLEANLLARFKQEFRLLSGIIHPNLVTLYELFGQNEEWFFTMERVDGLPLLDAVYSTSSATGEAPATLSLASPTATIEASVLEQQYFAARHGAAEGARIRQLLHQVVEGLGAIHSAQRLHRDIKPSNILVTPEGRAVILDFGLAIDRRIASPDSSRHQLVGTIPYMSPEQSLGHPQGPASDFYSVGVILFQALTGRYPFQGSTKEILAAKQSREAPRPRTLIPLVPEELDDLCSQLLRRNPAERPGLEDILRALRGESTPSPAPTLPDASAVFVGRESELEQLGHILQSPRASRPCVLSLEAPSGLGKSTLLEHALNAATRRGVLVLSGRCYEQEAVPFQAMDGVMDALASHLAGLPEEHIDRLRPPDAGVLARVFPILGQVPGFVPSSTDAFDTRKRAFRALRALLHRLAEETNLILSIDDLQWGDLDSAVLLTEILRQPQAPRLVLLTAYRQGTAATSECISHLLDSVAEQKFPHSHIQIGPMQPDAALALARRFAPQAPAARLASIVREANGNPFFVRELARDAALNPDDAPADSLASLDDLLWKRSLRLPESARAFLEVVSVAGVGLPQADAFTATGLTGRDPAISALLRGANLVKLSGSAALDTVEPYHDRVRESIVAHLSSERLRSIHRSLADTLAASGRADAEFLAIHLEGAEDFPAASLAYADAAAAALAVTAYDRAARHFAKASQYSSSPQLRASLQASSAEAFVSAGRAFEAAQAFASAADLAEKAGNPQLAADLLTQAGYNYCSSGHLLEGRRVFDLVLRQVGLALPANNLLAMLRFFWMRARLQWRGLDFTPRNQESVPAPLRARLKAAEAVGHGLGMIDISFAMSFGNEALRLALEAGDRPAVVRNGGLHMAVLSVFDKENQGLTPRVGALVDRLAEESQDPVDRAYALFGKFMATYGWCHHAESIPLARSAEDLFLRHAPGANFEIDTMRVMRLFALTHIGRFREVLEECPNWIEQADARGNLFVSVSIGSYMLPLAQIVAGRVREARLNAQTNLTRWNVPGFHLQHLTCHNALNFCDIAEGDGPSALARTRQIWPQFKAVQFHRILNLRIYWHDIRGRALCLTALRDPQPDPLLAEAASLARQQLREPAPHAPGMGHTILAAIAQQRGLLDLAQQHLLAAIAANEAARLPGPLAATQLCFSRLFPHHPSSDAFAAAAQTYLTEENIRDPRYFLSIFTAGFRP